jgi:hypothetical protein
MAMAEVLLGKEGARIWKSHFAPSSPSDQVIKVPFEWVNFLSFPRVTKKV